MHVFKGESLSLFTLCTLKYSTNTNTNANAKANRKPKQYQEECGEKYLKTQEHENRKRKIKNKPYSQAENKENMN